MLHVKKNNNEKKKDQRFFFPTAIIYKRSQIYCICKVPPMSYQSVFVLLSQQLGLVALHWDFSQALGHLSQPVQHLHLLLPKQLCIGQGLIQHGRSPRAPITKLCVPAAHCSHSLTEPIVVYCTAERGERLAKGLEMFHLFFPRQHLLLEGLGFCPQMNKKGMGRDGMGGGKKKKKDKTKEKWPCMVKNRNPNDWNTLINKS